MEVITLHTKKDCMACEIAQECLRQDDAYYMVQQANVEELFSKGIRSLPVIEYKGQYHTNLTMKQIANIVAEQRKEMEEDKNAR